MCRLCPKWDGDREEPRPTLGQYELALAELLDQVRLTGALPAAGGVLDQDPDLMDALAVISQSEWYILTRGS